MEQRILKTCLWSITAPTLYQWTLWLLSQWDAYCVFLESPYPVFTTPSGSSYALYRKSMQLVDLMVIDLDHFRFPLKRLAAGAILTVLSEVQDFQDRFQSDFEVFLGKTIEVSEVEAEWQYAARFLELPVCMDPPRARVASKAHYMDYLSIQTYAKGGCSFIKKKLQLAKYKEVTSSLSCVTV